MPGQVPVINPTGNARLATAGTGDVLAGWMGARLAAHDTTPFHADAGERIRWEPFAGHDVPFLACRDLAVFKAFFDALKPGGTLGVVEHRARPGTSFEQQVKTGYMTEDYVIGLAEKAGFKLVEKSDINANAKDTTDHPNGVWTLPPMSRGRLEPEKYLAIGESDRMTLKFVKP